MDGAAPVARDDDDDFSYSVIQQRSLRLKDAERIAFERLDGAPQGSLKEALATTIVTPEPTGLSLGQRLKEAAAADEAAFLRPFQAAPISGFAWSEAVPPAHTVPLFEVPEAANDLIAPVAAPVPDEPSQPSPAPVVGLPWAETAALPIDSDMSSLVDQEFALSLIEPEHREFALPQHDAGAWCDTQLGLGSADQPDGAEEVVVPHEAVAPSVVVPLLPEDPRLEPIVTAFAASARLAADATAASQALHHLKRLLADQLVEDLEPDAAETLERPVAREPDAAVVARIEAPLAGAQVDTAAPLRDQLVPPPIAVRDQPVPPPLPPVSPPSQMVAPLPSAAPVVPPPIPLVAAVGPAPFKPTQTGPALPRDVPAEPLPQIVSKARVLSKEPRKPAAPMIAEAASTSRAREDIAASAFKPAAKPSAEPSPSRALVRRPSNLPVPVSPPAEMPRTAFDVGGFCAGFVLSGAIGVLLYFVMAAG